MSVSVPRLLKAATAEIPTVENLSIPVDYDDAAATTVVDPPVGKIFQTQQEWDDYLTEQGATAYKHAQKVWEAIPELIRHTVVFDLKPGVHRPDPSVSGLDFMWDLNGKTMDGGYIVFRGPYPTTWPAIDPSLENLTIDSFQQGGGDPWLDVSTSHPNVFSSFDIAGSFAITSDGLISVISGYTAAGRIELMSQVLPNPTPGSSTVSIVRPDVILRNSADDVSAQATFGGVRVKVLTKQAGGWPDNYVDFEGVTLQKFTGAQDAFNFELPAGSGSITWTLVDAFTYPSTDGLGLDISRGYINPYQSSFRGNEVGPDAPMMARQAARLEIFETFVKDWSDGVTLQEGSRLRMFNVVLENLGEGSGATDLGALTIQGGSIFDFYGPFATGARTNEIRNIVRGRAALYLGKNAQVLQFGGGFAFDQHLKFSNNTKPCVYFGENQSLDFLLHNGPLFVDGGGNTDVGVEMGGPYAAIFFPATVSVTGVLGDIRMADGDILSYTDLVTAGEPFVDTVGLNLVRKAT